MTKILTDTSWNELCQETSFQLNGFETIAQGKIPDVCNTYGRCCKNVDKALN